MRAYFVSLSLVCVCVSICVCEQKVLVRLFSLRERGRESVLICFFKNVCMRRLQFGLAVGARERQGGVETEGVVRVIAV